MINFYQSYIAALLEWFSCWNLIILWLDLLSIFKIHGECACYTPVHKCDSRYYSYLFGRPSLQKTIVLIILFTSLISSSYILISIPFMFIFISLIQRWTLSCSCWRNRSQRSLVRSDLQIEKVARAKDKMKLWKDIRRPLPRVLMDWFALAHHKYELKWIR